MSSTSDPNELAPLTELGNRILRERTVKLREFASSSKWAASAIVVQLDEAMGFRARVGFELRTPLEAPFQDVITGWGPNREEAVRLACQEWLDLALPAALAIHSDKDPHARLGETQIGERIYSWRMAAGVLRAVGPDADTVMADLAKSDLFTRLNLAGALPLQREAAWLCLKLGLHRPAEGAETRTALINHGDWLAGRELLQRFVLPGVKPLEVVQYLFLRRTGKRGAGGVTGAAAPAAPSKSAPGKKPWWKVW